MDLFQVLFAISNFSVVFGGIAFFINTSAAGLVKVHVFSEVLVEMLGFSHGIKGKKLLDLKLGPDTSTDALLFTPDYDGCPIRSF